MDAFVAMARLNKAPFYDLRMLEDVDEALRSVPGFSKSSMKTFRSDDLYFTCRLEVERSDSVFVQNGNDSMLFVHGPVAVLGAGNSELVRCNPDAARGGGKRSVLAIQKIIESATVEPRLAASLSGSFHAVNYDRKREQTVLLIDRLASRPIFRFDWMNFVFFSSDVRLLLSLPWCDNSVDYGALAQIIRFQMVLGAGTLYPQVAVEPPAATVVVEHGTGQVRTTTYWELAATEPFRNQAEAVDAVAAAFRSATSRQLRDSSYPAVLLSDGLDSRMLLAALHDQVDMPLSSSTFGPNNWSGFGLAAEVASLAGIPWEPIIQSVDKYWDYAADIVSLSSGLLSFYHGHTSYPAHALVSRGHDVALDGWGLDLLFSGSYFPKHYVNVLGRTIYTYRLSELRTPDDVVQHLFSSLDIQQGDFATSLLADGFEHEWTFAPLEALISAVSAVTSRSATPYDWIDYVLFGCGIGKFRSYPMVLGIRGAMKERNPLFESDILDTYCALPYQWRYLGPVFRKALLRLDPDLARVRYGNTGTSPYAPPAVQAAVLQVRSAIQANQDRLSRLAAGFGVGTAAAPPRGPYPHPHEMARFLVTRASARRLLLEGPLVEVGIVDAARVRQALRETESGDDTYSLTLLVLCSLSLWFDAYPARFS